ncbi:hypothetical protein GIB67_039225 [Kingdonia uniflora]|uniref:Homeobox-DDT domain protein RLT2 n=1 Tax=Kingdonia uniflora TaxID=39325 RepID=A0A7J7MM62_9MAGN|nr:hypothetical protein GIB67_039225 [Kingdonia uniflora]
MESTPDMEKKKPSEGDSKSKRKMKTPAQLEILEQTYSVETYPSEAIRAELSVKLDLTDRQLQMWFCHRRLKDRKAAANGTPVSAGQSIDEMVAGETPGNEPAYELEYGSGSGSSPFDQKKVGVGVVAVRTITPPVSRSDMVMAKRYKESPQVMLESRAIAFVEAQIGEAVREDGPILGMEFDPLPPGAFGAPIVVPQQKQLIMRPHDGKMYDRRDVKSIKTLSILPSMEHSVLSASSGRKKKLSTGSAHPEAATRALHEYQFLPQHPGSRSETYERADSFHVYSSPVDGPSSRSLSSRGPFIHGKEQLATNYGFQAQVQDVGLLSQQATHSHVFASDSGDYNNVRHKNSNIDMEAVNDTHPGIGLENQFLSSDRLVSIEEDASRMERKRKIDEAKIAREVEVHEKRIRKELEKQNILRRKREEQMRRDIEKHDRERRKEEERLMREKQREEERFQREQRRELERREKFMQKESLRAERMKQKEESRKEKEATRLKAANERATARKIAKESMELIEDERLELMELAASSKGASSLISLDTETLENLDLFRDMLSTFPPQSVRLKRPFAVQPWTDSEENIGNLLMVWRFIITFVDVLDLWPFTLDEFVQALHDYDPRLLGEIHVALLRSIIKDIEDVARTPFMALGANQNSAANPGGGHPQIVEGAYAWGFDIRSWQRHLNPMTWPEMLRQFALSAGFGPKLKKRSLGRTYFRDDNEGHDGEDIISTLRNGAAAVNAATVMQEKGFSHPRRSRHRLTPGTVKFAAFHVLSLEGSKGLTILEVADRIQKSGLRDLTTSKTPEASIAAALSRDTILFERTAPSTYCVRAAYRKDPADADAILSAAREKIHIFETGDSDSEVEKEAEDTYDVEKDDDFECDVTEDPEVDDGVKVQNPNKVPGCSNEANTLQPTVFSGNGTSETLYRELGETSQSGLVKSVKDFSSFLFQGSKEIDSLGATMNHDNVIVSCNEANNADNDTEIDESNTGEPWVQGLTEGEYSDLSVEERLNALVALIEVAIEGNSIRVILEERLEAASAVKKQMWAEAQLDKRRMKEEYLPKMQYSSYMGIKAEQNLTSCAADGGIRSACDVDIKNDATSDPSMKQEANLDLQNAQNLDLQSAQNYSNNLTSEKIMLGQESIAGLDNLQQQVYAAEKSRSQLKSYIGHKAEELYVYRSLPLGQDRRRNRYWQFVTSASRNDPGCGRIFFESQGGCWRLIDSEEAFDALLASLDTRGIREAQLHSMLQRIELSFREFVRRNSANVVNPSAAIVKAEASERGSGPDSTAEVESPSSSCNHSHDTLDDSSSFKIELGRTGADKMNSLKRYEDFQKWMWKECYNPSMLCAMKFGKKRCTELLLTCDFCHSSYFFEDNHCSLCHRTFGASYNLSFSDHVNQCMGNLDADPDWAFHASDSSLPLRVRLFKAQLALIEVSIPTEAFQPHWTKEYRNSWGAKLLSLSSVEELLQFLTLLEGAIKRDWLSSNFETCKELLRSSTPPGFAIGGSFDLSASVPVLPWVPQTTAAVALRLMELDASIAYMLHQKESHKEKEAVDFDNLPSRYTIVKNIHEVEPPIKAHEQVQYLIEENWVDPGIGCSSSGRGRGGRGRGGRGRNRGKRLQRGGNGPGYGTGSSGLRHKSKTRGRGGRKRGRRTVRGRFVSDKSIVEKEMDESNLFGVRVIPEQFNGEESPRSSEGGLDWGVEARRRLMHVDGAANGGSLDASESDDNGQEYDDNEADYAGVLNGTSDYVLESDEDIDEDEDIGDEGDADGEGMDLDGQQHRDMDLDEDEGTPPSTSSGYSD